VEFAPLLCHLRIGGKNGLRFARRFHFFPYAGK
jgi:hypothetical protein